MTSCSLVSDSLLKLIVDDNEHYINIVDDLIVSNSPNHFIITNEIDIIQAELLLGINEIFIRYGHNGYQIPMNEDIKNRFLNYKK
jgi:hypothetical protein